MNFWKKNLWYLLTKKMNSKFFRSFPVVCFGSEWCFLKFWGIIYCSVKFESSQCPINRQNEFWKKKSLIFIDKKMNSKFFWSFPVVCFGSEWCFLKFLGIIYQGLLELQDGQLFLMVLAEADFCSSNFST